MKKIHFFIVLALITFNLSQLLGQSFRPIFKKPNDKAITSAYKIAEKLFADLKANKTQEVAEWIVANLGKTWDASTKVQNVNSYKSKLDVIRLSPPSGSYGKLVGYDLIDESYLPGSDRYFRLVYISYHEESPLIWEFRFYVKPDGDIAPNYISWDDTNPFEIMSTNKMLLMRWYEK
jgi:hypothetical protein